MPAASVADRWEDIIARLSEALDLPADSIEQVAFVCYRQGKDDALKRAEDAALAEVTS